MNLLSNHEIDIIENIYQKESIFLDSDKINNTYYIGSYFKLDDDPNLFLSCAITSTSFFKYNKYDIMKYLYYYSCVEHKSEINIMKLYIINNCYYVLIKTYWLRIIQRHIKKNYSNKIKIIKNSIHYFEIKGKYIDKFPSIKGMLSVYNKKK